MAARGNLTTDAPFVLTLEIDGGSFSLFDGLRRTFYPPERNVVPAHVTIFHRLPGERGREIKALLAIVAGSRSAFSVDVGEVKATERGVAVFLGSRELHALREDLVREWQPWLTDLDRRGFQPHVTIAGDLTRGEARHVVESVAAAVRPRRRVQAVGLHLWRYLDGPWRSERLFRFH